ncbi:hypothetical protein VZ95_05115, partial [Elstera litoralis]
YGVLRGVDVLASLGQPISRVSLPSSNRNHQDQQLIVPDLIDQTIPCGARFDLTPIWMAAEFGGRHARHFYTLRQLLLKQ